MDIALALALLDAWIRRAIQQAKILCVLVRTAARFALAVKMLAAKLQPELFRVI